MRTISILLFAALAVYALSFLVTPLVAAGLRYSYRLARPKKVNKPTFSFHIVNGVATFRSNAPIVYVPNASRVVALATVMFVVVQAQEPVTPTTFVQVHLLG